MSPGIGTERGTLWVMPKRRPVMGGRYNYRTLTLRVEQMRVDCGLLAKEAAADIGISEAAWSKKVNANQSSFSLEEFGQVADAFARRTGRKLVGWPFIDADLSDLLQR